jgi:hypothetical protein
LSIIDADVFYDLTTAEITLHVLSGTEDLYRVDPVWGGFNIVAIPTGIHTPAVAEGIRIYPNPVTESFRIDGIDGPVQVTVINSSGQTMFRQTVSADEVVATDKWPNGVYLVGVNGKTVKVIKR